MRVEEIKDPSFLKDLDIQATRDVCEDIRRFLLENISKTGGHLASNLGILETSVELLKIFDGSKDKIIYDVGHQSYVHKILTGRADKMNSLRQIDGIAGFQKRVESNYDVFEAGHSSTSLSAALGMAVARDLKHEDYQVIGVIGDGAMGGGMALEALNHIGEVKAKMIIILNDNEMSISENIGGISRVLSSIRISPIYTESKHDLKNILKQSRFGMNVLKTLRGIRNFLKRKLVGTTLFTNFGIDYLGPIDGHDLKELEKTFKAAKEHEGPIVVHVKTIKGHGYKYAEDDKCGVWHGVGPFDIKSGKFTKTTSSDMISYSELVTKTLIKIKETNDKVVVITPAMKAGSKLDEFFTKYPNSSFDCGIAEEHALTFGAGLAANGMQPCIAIYSSFLQRAYDQINHDISRMNLGVVVCIDRAGIVGEDGETHHGVFDLSILRALPSVVIGCPKDGIELQNMLNNAFLSHCPYFIRFPRGNTSRHLLSSFDNMVIGTWTKEYESNDIKLVIVTYGEYYLSLKEEFIKSKRNVLLVNARFVKPLDLKMLEELTTYSKWLVVEESSKIGGLSSAISEYVVDHKLETKVTRIGIEDHFVSHGDVNILRERENISINKVKETIEVLINA